MKKRILSLVLAVLMLCSLLPTGVMAAESEESEETNETVETIETVEEETAETSDEELTEPEELPLDGDIPGGECGDGLLWELNDGTLTISGEGAMADYEYGETPWYSLRENITSVVIENGVTRIGNSAFGNCVELETVNIPDSVKEIGESAFIYCDKLGNVTLPEGLTVIGKAAFSCCNAFTSIAIPASVRTIGESAFLSCVFLESIKIPYGVTKIGHSAFYGCGLKSIEIPGSVTCLEDSLFNHCGDLESVFIPDSVTTIEDSVFASCNSLSRIVVDGNNSVFSSIGGVLFDKAGTTLLCYPAGKTNNYDIPAGTTAVGEYAFDQCIFIESVTIPSGVTTIGQMAFRRCISLKSITIPASVTSIKDAAFYAADGLKDIYYGGSEDDWKKIDIGIDNDPLDKAEVHFAPDESESEIVASGSCGADGDNLRWTLDKNGVLTITGSGAMADYSFAGTPWYSFYESITAVVIRNGVTRIGNYAFAYCVKLGRISIPGSVREIGESSFLFCEQLSDVTFSEGLTVIGENAFSSCTSLTSIAFPASIRTIEKCAFLACEKLERIEVSCGVTKIEDAAFCACGLKDIYYGGSEDDWKKIGIGIDNDPLTTATKHYNSTGLVEKTGWSVTARDAVAADTAYSYVFQCDMTAPDDSMAMLVLMTGTEPDGGYSNRIPMLGNSIELSLVPGTTLYYCFELVNERTGESYWSEGKKLTVPEAGAQNIKLSDTYTAATDGAQFCTALACYQTYIIEVTGGQLLIGMDDGGILSGAETVGETGKTVRIAVSYMTDGMLYLKAMTQGVRFAVYPVHQAELTELTLGVQQRCEDTDVLCFIAPAAGLYKLESEGATITMYNDNGSINGSASDVFTMRAFEPIYYNVDPYENAATLTVNEVTEATAASLTLGKSVTRSSSNTVFCFTVEADGMYRVKTDGGVNASVYRKGDAMQQSAGEPLSLMAGDVIFVAIPYWTRDGSLCVQKLSSADFTQLELGTKTVLEPGALYSFASEKGGNYILEHPGCYVASTGEQYQIFMDEDNNFLSIPSGRTVYLWTLSAGENETCVLRAVTEADAKELTLGEKASGSGLYRFGPECQGTYTLCYEYSFPEYGGDYLGTGVIYADGEGDTGLEMWEQKWHETVYFWVEAADSICVRSLEECTRELKLGESMTTSRGDYFSIWLDRGLYYLDAERGSYLEEYRDEVHYSNIWGGTILCVYVSGDYTFINNRGTFSFTLRPIEDVKDSLPALTVGKAQDIEKEMSLGSNYLCYFVAPKDGNYHIRCLDGIVECAWESGSNVYIRDDGVFTMAAGECVYLGVTSHWEDDKEYVPSEIYVESLSDARPAELTLGEPETSNGKLFSFTPSSAGWYVAESSDGAVRVQEAGTDLYTGFGAYDDGDRVFFCVEKPLELFLSLEPGYEDESITVRCAYDYDFALLSLGQKATSEKPYRFVAEVDGDYALTINGENGFLSVHDVNGTSLYQSWVDGYLHLSAGQNLYMYCYGDMGFSIDKVTLPALTAGEQITLTEQGETERYSFTATAAGRYIVYAEGANDLGGVTVNVQNAENKTTIYDQLLFAFLDLKAGETVYLDLTLTDKEGTVLIDREQNIVNGGLKLNGTITTNRHCDLRSFTPETDGLYIVTLSAYTRVYQDNWEFAYAKNIMYLNLNAGETYYFLQLNPDQTIKLQTLENYGSTAIALDTAKTSSGGTVYAFTAPESGLYTIRSSKADTYLYDSAGVELVSGESHIVSLAKGETAYLCVWPNDLSDNSVRVSRTGSDDLSDYAPLEANQRYEAEAGRFMFTAQTSGLYAITADGAAYASVIADGSGSKIVVARDGAMALFKLEAGKTALITVGIDEWGRRTSGTLKIMPLSDAPVIDVTANKDISSLKTGAIYRFTATQDGKHTITLLRKAAQYVFGAVYDQNAGDQLLYQYEDEIHPATCELKKGESLYICVDNGSDPSSALRITCESATADELSKKLDDITGDKTLNSDQKRNALYDLGTQVLKDALQKLEQIVDKLKELEETLTGDGDEVLVEVEKNDENEALVSNVSIIGAGLNEKSGEDSVVSLTVKSGAKQAELPDKLDKDKAVYLDMSLEGVKDSKALDVPVCVSFDVPQNIQWQLVQLVHYNEDGTVKETLEPGVKAAEGRKSATFVLDGFSTFALTELAHEPGNVDGKGKTDIADVMTLLKKVAGVTGVNVVYSDVDNDGKVDISDVMTLLKYVAGVTGVKIY